MHDKEVIIIGAGLVGSLLSIYLSDRGYKVTIYERRQDMRKEMLSAGRSINLALSDRGIRALEAAGVMDEVRPLCIPMHGRYIHKLNGVNTFQPYGKEGQFINSVSRSGLNIALINAAEGRGVNINFLMKCTGINLDKNRVTLEDSDSVQHEEIADIIFGSDGAFSASRLSHQLNADRFQYNQFYIDFGYKELTIPAGENSEFRMEKNALHIWPRGNYMLIALPNIDGSFTCTLFFPFEGIPSFASLQTPAEVKSFFSETFPDVVPLMPSVEREYFANQTSSLVTIKCFPWVVEDKFALIGDAAHAIVPFFGQGMNCGFEDCFVLNELIDKHAEDWNAILKEYQELRKPDADAIADMALNNFVEMRDKVGDEQFLLQKKIESLFNLKHPDKWIPAYSQVTFSPQIRYSEALASSIRQDCIMEQVMNMPDITDIWDGAEVEKKMLELLKR